MPTKKNQKDDLSTNQEHFIVFLVIGLFGLMYWFFMHGNDSDLDGKAQIITAQASSVAPVITDNKTTNSLT
jgi:hypothetical protein